MGGSANFRNKVHRTFDPRNNSIPVFMVCLCLDHLTARPWYVEHAGLDGEEDGDPLVVAVVEPRAVALPPRAHALEVGRNVERTKEGGPQ